MHPFECGSRLSDTFQLNRLELERNAQSAAALKRMNDILLASSPYSLIKEAESLIASTTVSNTSLITEARKQAVAKIDGYVEAITKDVEASNGDTTLRSSCLKPLETLKSRVQISDSLANITQAESEALKEFDAANVRIEARWEKAEGSGQRAEGSGIQVVAEDGAKPVVKLKRIIKPSELVASTYLETETDVKEFIQKLSNKLNTAITNNERIEIR